VKVEGLGASVTQEQVVNLAVALLVPIVTAVLGVLGVVVGDWRQRRTQAGRRKLALEDAGRQVSFAAEWWNARKLVADSPEAMREATTRAAAWLEEASALVAGSTPPPVDEKPPVTLRRLLLFYPLHGRTANILRGIFYGCVGFLLAAAGNAIDVALDPQARSQYLWGNSLLVVATAIVALGLRFWVGVAEAHSPMGKKGHRLTLRRSLLLFRRWFLLYRFHRRTASLVRILFYASLVVVFTLIGAAFTDLGKSELAADLSYIIAVSGYAAGLRYWAASLETIGKNGKPSHRPASTTINEESQAGASQLGPVSTDG
jgi:hypothetical protein